MKAKYYGEWESVLIGVKLINRPKFNKKGIQFLFRIKSSREIIKRTFSIDSLKSPRSLLNKWLSLFLERNNTEETRKDTSKIVLEVLRQARGSNFMLTLDNSKQSHIDIIGTPKTL